MTQQSDRVTMLPRLIFVKGQNSPLPLENTQVTGQITGPIASLVISQRFGNPLPEPAELDYLFALPDNSSVMDFELRIGSRTIQGDLRERDTARADYQNATEQGRRAGLLEQRRPNLFAVRLSNVQPGETIHAVLRCQQRIQFVDDSYEFVFPMGITPKYDSIGHEDEGAGVHAPLALAGERIGPVEIQISIDAGLSARDPSSPTHAIETTRFDARRFLVKLSGKNIPDRDFVLRYAVAGSTPLSAAWTSGEPGAGYFLAALVPPSFDGEPDPQPREFIFVLDRSGSMSGEPIRQARNALRACLRSLHPYDTFRILLFDNELDWFLRDASPVTQEAVDLADAYLDRVQGRGGTEIVSALNEALTVPGETSRLRYVVFLTDGAVSAEARAIEQVCRNIGSTRLFTFGIGSSVNRALLNRLAALGRGRASFLQLDEDIEDAVIRFQDSVSFPVLTDLILESENGKVSDVYPARLPDLFIGQPLEICDKVAQTVHQAVGLKVRGMRSGQPFQVAVEIQSPSGQDQAVERVWARARVDDLLDQQMLEPKRAAQIRGEIIDLATEFHLITQYTSFVAVDQETIRTGNRSTIIHVSQPLPYGLSHEAFDPGVSQPFAAMPMQSMNTLRSVRMPFTGASAKTISNLSMTSPVEDVRSLQRGYAEVPRNTDAGGILKWLARTQNIDGSWNGSVEQTAAALLGFVRNGHTTRVGTFRQVVRKAVGWLENHSTGGFACFARALAFRELAQVTGESKLTDLSNTAWADLPEPSSDLEAAVINGGMQAQVDAIQTLDDIRLAGVLRLPAVVPEALLEDRDADLAVTWAAAAV